MPNVPVADGLTWTPISVTLSLRISKMLPPMLNVEITTPPLAPMAELM